ncbi:hypothetical protein I4U23_010651 [Adineta vaga]|nr:hypothetical protein I4U23_010651 [Adineta vaga]
MLNLRCIFFIFIPFLIEGSVIDLSHFSILTSPSSYPSYKFNILHHLTAISPYFDSESNELNPDPPLGCTIDKAIYLVRHGSIYANDYDYEHTIEPFIKRLQSSLKQIDFSRSKELAFLATWNSPITNSDEQVEKLTQSGSNEAFKLGTQLASRYPNLKTKIWASSSNRTKESAASLFTGLSGNKKTIDDISIIMEEKNQGANTLSPTKTCSLFNITLGTQEAETWLKHYSLSIQTRLNNQIIGFEFSSNDILAMQELYNEYRSKSLY